MEIRRPGHRAEVGQALHVGAIELHGVNVGVHALFIEAPPDDALAVRSKERSAVVAGRVREPARVRAVGVHHVDLAERGRVGFETLEFVSGKFVRRIRVA